MKITSVKSIYELKAAEHLQISVSINNTEEEGRDRLYSFDPTSEDYGLLARLKVVDSSIPDEWEWEKPIDLKAELKYGFLDELIENMIFQWAKSMASDPDGMIGSYRTDDPVVAWLCQKRSFDKVMRGKAIRERVSYSAEITGIPDNGDVIKAVCDKYGSKAQRIRIIKDNTSLCEILLDNGSLMLFSDIYEKLRLQL